MKKMIFAMMIATGVLATGFANAQEKAKQETKAKTQKTVKAKRVAKTKDESGGKTVRNAKVTDENKAMKEEAGKVKAKGDKAEVKAKK
jgi:hypothetical protein